MDYGSPENIKSRYEVMSDSRLREFALGRNELTELGQELLRQEFESRGITMPDLPQAHSAVGSVPVAEPGYIIPEPDKEDVTELPLEYEDKFKRLITIRSYRDLSEAIIARAVLDGEGVYCFLRDENTVRMDWMWSNLIGGIRLQVAEEDAARANEILSQPIPESFVMEDGSVFEQPICPKCGSVDVVANNTGQKLGLASTVLLGFLAMPVTLPAMAMQRDDVWKCNACGTRWYDDDESSPS